MADYTFACGLCSESQTVPLRCGRKPVYCRPCQQERINAKNRADRAAIRVAPSACQQCGGPMPEGCRADAKWCRPACQSYNNRRARGEVAENTATCSSCLKPLTGMQSNAKVCRSPRCRGWAARNPGVPHPSTQPRVCAGCGKSIDHMNGKARYCTKLCGWLARVAADRAGYNAKALRYQQSEKGRAYRKAYREANVEQYRKYQRDARLRDPDRHRSYWKQWADANPLLVKDIAHLRRARQEGNRDSVGVSLRDWQRVVRRYRGCCAYCGEVADPLHMDHVVPLARGGRHAISNVLPACQSCNQRKHSMFLVVFRYRRGRTLVI